jgi:hypothetical protein
VRAVLGRRGGDAELLKHVLKIEHDLSALRKRVEKRRFIELKDPAFVDASQEAISRKRTSLREDRLWILWQAAHNVARLQGGHAAAEIGTYRGGSAYFIASAFVHALGHDVPFDVVDTFEGLAPEDRTSEDGDFGSKRTFTDTSVESVREYLSRFPQVVVHKGDIAEVAPTLDRPSYSLVHVDVDLYEPALECLRYFGPKVPVGGVIVLDDYEALKCPGIRKAVDEYLAEAPSFQPWNPHTEQLVLIRLP